MGTKKVNETEEVVETTVTTEVDHEVEEKIEETVEPETKDEEEPDQSPIEEDSKKPEAKTGKVVNSKFVRLRKAPSSNAQIETIMNEGDEADILEKIPGYYKISVKGKKGIIGYIASNYFKED